MNKKKEVGKLSYAVLWFGAQIPWLGVLNVCKQSL